MHCSPRIYRREIYFYKFVEVEVFLRKLVILVSLETNFFPQRSMFHTRPDIFVNGFFFSRFEINVIPICSLGPVQTPLHSCAEPN